MAGVEQFLAGVRRDENGAALRRDGAQTFGKPLPAGRVETGAGLVEDENLWIRQKREREAESLPHAAGELANCHRGVLRETGFLQQLRGARGRGAADVAIQLHRLRHGEIRVQPAGLRHVADQRANRASVAQRIASRDGDLSLRSR